MSSAGFDYTAGDLVAGRYRIVKPIGLGASAAVYRAVSAAGSGSVALKVMHETDPSGVGKQRFEREAALVQRLRHPHVVQLYDFGHTEQGQPFIAFELLEGRSLRHVIKREAPFDPTRIGRIALEVLGALDAAHRLGIIHRDIKPANIFLRRHAHGESAQVLDFGLAKALFGDEQAMLETLTRTGYRLGTPRYMSPEMARGERARPASDLYALGLVMGEAILGTPIVAGSSQIDVLMAHASQEPLPLGEAVARSPFATVIERAVAKSLEVRYRTAMQMHADVAAVLERLARGIHAGAAGEDELAATLQLDEARVRAFVPTEKTLPEPPVWQPPAPPVAPPPRRGGARLVIVFVALAIVAAALGYWLGT